MAMLGMGNGSVFPAGAAAFPQGDRRDDGVVGAAGGLGGFFFPTLLGFMGSGRTALVVAS